MATHTQCTVHFANHTGRTYPVIRETKMRLYLQYTEWNIMTIYKKSNRVFISEPRHTPAPRMYIFESVPCKFFVLT